MKLMKFQPGKKPHTHTNLQCEALVPEVMCVTLRVSFAAAVHSQYRGAFLLELRSASSSIQFQITSFPWTHRYTAHHISTIYTAWPLKKPSLRFK